MGQMPPSSSPAQPACMVPELASQHPESLWVSELAPPPRSHLSPRPGKVACAEPAVVVEHGAIRL